MGVTQKEIAERLNMSQSHVARALRGDLVVAERTRLRVKAIAEEMGYDGESNREARVMASRRFGQRVRTGVVAIVFPPEAESPRFIPFYRAILDAMEREAERVGMDICICPCREARLPRLVRDHNVDGVIAMNYRVNMMSELDSLGLPVVTFHVQHGNAHSVMSNDYDGACQATRHLLELGHRDIAYLGAIPLPDEAPFLRFQGFCDTMREHGVPVREEWVEMSLPLPKTTDEALCIGCGACAVCCGWDTLQERLHFKEGQSLPFTAMICHNDPIAMSLADMAGEHGYRVPEDLSVVGFDNVSRLYRFQPVLTSVDLGRAELGQQAMRLLYEVIEEAAKNAESESDSIEYRHVMCPVSLAVQGSTLALQRPTLAAV
jgi:LacI family transcriptional regulator